MAKTMLKDPVSVEVSPRNSTVKAVQQSVIVCDKKRKPELFLHLLKKKRWGQVLVFVKTRKGVETLVTTLQEHGISADSIHGDKTQPARLRALARLKKAEVQLLVATDVAARGLDIQALPQVVNFDLPTVAEDYIHRIGRTGRAGMEGEAVSLVCADEVDMLKAIETLTRQVIHRIEEPGFEAEHRVPETGPKGVAAALAKKAAAEATAKKKRPFTGPAGGKAAPGNIAPAGKPAVTARPAGGDASLGTWIPPVPAGKPTGGARSAGGKPAAGRIYGGGKPAAAAPKGAVVVTGGRGAKSLARAAGKVTAKPGGRKTGPR